MRRAEPDAALGNGGLGRLAACLMESMASLGIPAFGYGIRYDHGLFRQVIRDGWQQEFAEDWLSFGNPWEFARPEVVYDIQFGGRVEMASSAAAACGRSGGPMRRSRRSPTTRRSSAGAAGTSTRCGCGRRAPWIRCASTCSTMATMSARCREQARAEAISKILYPSDNTSAGRELRLRQEYFFVSASLQDILRRHLQTYNDLPSLSEHAAIQLNDTHPSIAVAELMRLLLDVYALPWDVAWQTTVGTFSYTNHTLLPEALETLAGGTVRRVLPRHLEIIYRINAQHLEAAREHSAGRRSTQAARLDHRREPTAAACGWAISRLSARIASTASRRCTPI